MHPGSVGDLLVSDNAGDGGDDIHDAGRMIEGSAEDVEMLGGGFDVHFGFVCGVFGDLKIVERNCAVIVETFGAIELGVG